MEEIEEIEKNCEKFVILKYDINDDMSIDVYQDVCFDGLELKYLPLSFNIVHGSFSIKKNLLVSLKGAPRVVIGNFNCSINNLTSLDGGPHLVTGDFFCQFNRLKNLEGSPFKLKGSMICYRNKLTTLRGVPRTCVNLDISFNAIRTLHHLPEAITGDFYCWGNRIKKIWNIKVGGTISCEEKVIINYRRKIVIDAILK